MAVTLGTPTTSSLSGSAATSFSFTVPPDQEAIYVAVGYWWDLGNQVVSVTWNDLVFARIVASPPSQPGGDVVMIYRLQYPPAGTANMVITHQVGILAGGIGAVCANGIDAVLPEGAPGTEYSEADGTATDRVTVGAVPGDVILVSAANGGGTAMTPNATGATPVELWDLASGGERYQAFKVDGAATEVWSSGFTIDGWSITAVPIRQSVAPVISTTQVPLVASRDFGRSPR